MPAVYYALFLVSGCALAMELVLLRALSIAHWHHFGYLVISTALLGFGTGGILVTLFSEKLKMNFLKWLFRCCLGFGILVPVSFNLCQAVNFDELQLIWDRRQIFYLLGYYLLLFLPFLAAGSFVALCFSGLSKYAHKLYFANMTGSGAGVLGAVILMNFMSPVEIIMLIVLIVLATAIMLGFYFGKKRVILGFLCGFLLLFVFSEGGVWPLEMKTSQHKALSYYKAVPEAKILETNYSPMGRVDFLTAPTARHFPGLGIGFTGQLPKQILMITDADAVSAVNHFEDMNDLKCYDFTTSAVAYHLFEEPKICVLGAGGGSDICQGLYHNSDPIYAVELNNDIVESMKGRFSDFSSNIYERDEVRVRIAEARNFIRVTDEKFDIINLSFLDSFSSAASGTYALNENHLYTVESFKEIFKKLKKEGVVCISRNLKQPARDLLKLVNIIKASCEEMGIEEVEKKLAVIRNWSTGSILCSLDNFDDNRKEDIRKFCEEKYFDVVYLDGYPDELLNRFNVLDEPIYHEGVVKILEGDEAFIDDYIYDVRAATDDRPYFSNFFKWESLPYLMKTLPDRWLRFSEWGYLIQVLLLVQSAIVSIIFIILPLFFKTNLKKLKSYDVYVFLYFLMLGYGFMFLEMGYIQKMTLLSGHPVLGASISLLSFLFFSGVGAISADKFIKQREQPVNLPAVNEKKLVIISVILIAGIGLAELAVFEFFLNYLLEFSTNVRFVMGVIFICPLAFFMGVPFPTGLRAVNSKESDLVPWAWGINGFASVTGAVLGSLLAISAGFSRITLAAIVLYLIAASLINKLFTGIRED